MLMGGVAEGAMCVRAVKQAPVFAFGSDAHYYYCTELLCPCQHEGARCGGWMRIYLPMCMQLTRMLLRALGIADVPSLCVRRVLYIP